MVGKSNHHGGGVSKSEQALKSHMQNMQVSDRQRAMLSDR